MPCALVGLAMLSGLRRGELFALRWRDVDEQARPLTVREAVYDGVFSTPKTEAGDAADPALLCARRLIEAWKPRAGSARAGQARVLHGHGHVHLPEQRAAAAVFPACKRPGLPSATWLTFRRTYSSWSHDKGVPGKVVAQLMGHANVDTTLNVYTQVLDGSLRAAVEKVGGGLFTIVHKPEVPEARR